MQLTHKEVVTKAGKSTFKKHPEQYAEMGKKGVLGKLAKNPNYYKILPLRGQLGRLEKNKDSYEEAEYLAKKQALEDKIKVYLPE